MSMYTPQKVYRLLAPLLPPGAPTCVNLPRFSEEKHWPGLAAQMAALFEAYAPGSPALQTMQSWPEEVWNPEHAALGAQYGVRWLRLADLHHLAEGEDPLICVVLVGDQLLVGATLSTTKRHIAREDGEDENAYLVLLMALMNHYRSLRALRWVEDVTRAARDDFGWSSIKRKCKDRGIRIVLAGRSYDLHDQGDELALKALGIPATQDDDKRRKALTGKRLLKYMSGGAAIAEDQMPHGWRFARDDHGRARWEGMRGYIPEGEFEIVPALHDLYRRVAAGETWTRIADHLIAWEAKGNITRRAHASIGATYADIDGDPGARYGAAKGVFVRGNGRPKVAPTEAAIADYERGGDPAVLFTPEIRLFLGKVELVRTGRYFRRLTNDIRGRNVVLHGLAATYQDEDDEFGWFDVLSESWAWPADPVSGEPLDRFGISDQTCRKVGARLLRELRQPPAESGGRVHHSRVVRRVLQDFNLWNVEPGTPGARYDDEPTEYGIEARQNNSGKDNFIVLFRRHSVGGKPNGDRRGLSWLGLKERKPEHIAATGSLDDLTGSVAAALDDALTALAGSTELATFDGTAPAGEDLHRRRVSLEAQLSRLAEEAAALRRDADNQRLMAGRKVDAGDLEGADRYDQLATRKTAESVAKDQDRERVRQELAVLEDALRAATRSREAEVDVSVGAWLVAGLRRAVYTGGRGSAVLGKLADKTFTDWNFRADDEDLHWGCVAELPLRDGGKLRLPLASCIRNVRARPGKGLASADVVARYVLDEGRDIKEVATILAATRRTLIVKILMPWLVANKVKARGAKSSLLDHPLPAVRRIVYAAVTGTDNGVAARWPEAVSNLVISTYTDADLPWGDAAVPDDVRPVMRLAATLDQPGMREHGLLVSEASLLLGVSEEEVRSWVVPVPPSSGGFKRPRYLQYVPGSNKQRIELISCPHGRCRGRASHVVMLAEVARSGFGVLCPVCRRAPRKDDTWKWIAFPSAYLGHWSRTEKVGFRQAPVTAAVPAPVPYAVDQAGAA